jgi:hypothetical protein
MSVKENGMSRRTTRSALTAIRTGMIVALAFPLAAHAGNGTGLVQCDQQHPQPGCTAAAVTTGNAAIGSAAPSNDVCHNSNGAVIACQTDHGWAGPDGCDYTPTEPSNLTAMEMGMGDAGPDDQVGGAWYLKSCTGTDMSTQALVFLTTPPVAVPEVLARHARSMLRLPPPGITVNPPGDQLVGLPTWFSTPAASWQTQSATAEAAGVTITATARPVQAVWQNGDGSSAICSGPGTPWTGGTDPTAASPDCGHLYTTSSSVMPGAMYTVTVTVTWLVTWAGAGQTGTVAGMNTTATAPLTVR